ncbi:MAG TPA: serine/threonine-protein kinase [Pirellulales bacterium]
MAELNRASWWALYDCWALARVEAFDCAADEFEAGWRRGEDPPAGDFLLRAMPAERPFWLAEFLAIEMLARRGRGESLDQDGFLQRYPDDADSVRRAWSETFAEPPAAPTRTLVERPEPARERLLRDRELLDGRYMIDRFVRRGGMGELYQGHSVDRGFTFAFKVLDVRKNSMPEHGEDDAESRRTALARFLREMNILAVLRHPNLVASIELLRLAHLPPVIVMDWVDGKNLQTLVHEGGPLPVTEACEIARQAADGLEHAWRKYELVHRDVKPSNIMLTPQGEVKVLDFGLARTPSRSVHGGDEQLTAGDIRMGTIDYMAPEQWEDPRQVSSPADVYSLGVTLFFLLTGKTPFTIGHSSPPEPLRLRQAHAVLAPPKVRDWRPEVDVRLSRLIDRMLAKEPANRPTLVELLSELPDWSAGAELPRHFSSVVADEKNKRRGRAFWTRRRILLAACGFCGGGTAALATVFRGRILPPPELTGFHLTLYEAATKTKPEQALGAIGNQIEDVPAAGLVRLDLALNAACHVQLFTANSDGDLQLLAASAADRSAAEGDLGRVRALSFPRQGRWKLCDAEGLQAFVLIASRDPLPAFDAWRAKQRLNQLWSGAADRVGVWKTQAGAILPVHADDITPRGGQVESNVPAGLQRFWDGIRRALPPRATAELMAFSVS